MKTRVAIAFSIGLLLFAACSPALIGSDPGRNGHPNQRGADSHGKFHADRRSLHANATSAALRYTGFGQHVHTCAWRA